MTREQKRQLLCGRLETLRSWPQDFELSLFIHHCLEIVNIISGYDRHSRFIAKSLRLITRSHKESCLNSSVRCSLVDLESNLPPELRGFGNLFDIIIEENILRLDTQDLIESLPARDQQIAQIFLELIHSFDTYDQINTFCDAQNSRVLAVIFLRALHKVFDILCFPPDIINFWLVNTRINKQIVDIFNDDISCDNPGNLIDKDKLIFFLCLCSTEHVLLKKDIASRVEIALKQAHLPALSLFIEGGIISIEV